MSPGSINADSFLIVSSTGLPAWTKIITLRGLLRRAINSSALMAPTRGKSPSNLARATVVSTFAGERLPTHTLKP
ncbi:unnamed protein product [Pseudo-nitzschia multistriata]|uniref:Uncharacterized protein n=1 Tax=Pseudo-nitzschia multistriata TaxID=183589 RepID=A0A448ZJ21_9STRA|nr:unnamed protein product [Pseudo-nitzschia multistriata]